MDKLKKVLCTGGTGFVAHWLFETKPNDVDLYGLNRGAYQEPWEPGDWDYIIHLAPISPDRVIDYCQHKHIKFLHASSGAVYEGKGKYADDKRAWVARRFGESVPVICCASKDKAKYGQPGDILIDDWEKHKAKWLKMGGIWITHTDAVSTINQLQAMGL